MIGYWHHTVVCLSVCDAVPMRRGAHGHGRCKALSTLATTVVAKNDVPVLVAPGHEK